MLRFESAEGKLDLSVMKVLEVDAIRSGCLNRALGSARITQLQSTAQRNRYASKMRHHLLLVLTSVVLVACGSGVPQHSEFSVGMSRSEILSRFGEPRRTQSLTKSGDEIWGAIEEFWPQIRRGAIVEIWAYDSRIQLIDAEREIDQQGQTELYFVEDSETVTGIGFHVSGAVYEGC